jgi:hypothetical protein
MDKILRKHQIIFSKKTYYVRKITNNMCDYHKLYDLHSTSPRNNVCHYNHKTTVRTPPVYSDICFFFPEGGVGLVPKRGCLLTLAYYAFPRWYEFGERRWNDILTGENRITRRKTCPSATLSITNPTWIDPGANPGPRGERLATNDLSHGTALVTYVTADKAGRRYRHCIEKKAKKNLFLI